MIINTNKIPKPIYFLLAVAIITTIVLLDLYNYDARWHTYLFFSDYTYNFPSFWFLVFLGTAFLLYQIIKQLKILQTKQTTPVVIAQSIEQNDDEQQLILQNVGNGIAFNIQAYAKPDKNESVFTQDQPTNQTLGSYQTTKGWTLDADKLEKLVEKNRGRNMFALYIVYDDVDGNMYATKCFVQKFEQGRRKSYFQVVEHEIVGDRI